MEWLLEYPGWDRIRCGICTNGLTSLGNECDVCLGNGHLWRHLESKVLAVWPGGPFRGHDS